MLLPAVSCWKHSVFSLSVCAKRLLARYITNRLQKFHHVFTMHSRGQRWNRLHFEVKRSQAKVTARTDALFRWRHTDLWFPIDHHVVSPLLFNSNSIWKFIFYGAYVKYLHITEYRRKPRPPHSCCRISLSSLGMLTSCSNRGLRVTIPDPRGKKSRPTRFSRTELLPELWNTCTYLTVKDTPQLAKIKMDYFLSTMTAITKTGIDKISCIQWKVPSIKIN